MEYQNGVSERVEDSFFRTCRRSRNFTGPWMTFEKVTEEVSLNPMPYMPKADHILIVRILGQQDIESALR